MDVFGYLKTAGLLTEAAIAQLSPLVEAGAPYEKVLLEFGLSKEAVRKALSESYGVPSFIFEEEQTISQVVLKYIPEESARHYRIMPLAVEDGVLIVGANDPDNLHIR